MKITALLVLKCDARSDGSDPVILANATDVNHFGYFQRVTVGSSSSLLVGPSSNAPLLNNDTPFNTKYKVHSYNRNGLCVVGFMDDHYPLEVHSLYDLHSRSKETFGNHDDLATSVQYSNETGFAAGSTDGRVALKHFNPSNQNNDG
ncbi:hypothetical protein L2E82_13122 [Cichorium intybus]|uniref:Uncharacterized protein n=1 Tax=Cichorium intybus TaxID=13427 RepID=A0ACB9GHY3_CICIN|nr:hypothetical protein L2E82_13122 [Cichorium intybus]